MITPRPEAGVVTRLKMNLRSPSPSPQGLTSDDEVGAQSVDGVSDSPCTSNDIRTDGQPEVGRGLPSIDENTKKYLKKHSRVIFKRLLQYGRNKEAVQMVRNGLMSKRTLREILPEITEYPDVSAYILMKLNEDMQTKQKFVI